MSAALTGLCLGTSYISRIRTANAVGTATGLELPFTTLGTGTTPTATPSLPTATPPGGIARLFLSVGAARAEGW